MALFSLSVQPMHILGRPKKAHVIFWEFSSGNGSHVCTLSGSLPCSKLQLMKNIGPAVMRVVGSGEQFGGWRLRSDWARVRKSTVFDRFWWPSFLVVFDRFDWARFWLECTLGGLAMGRLLARALWALWAGSGSRRRRLCQGSGCLTAEIAGARLNSQDGTLSLISTTVIANPSHLRTFFALSRKTRAMTNQLLGSKDFFPYPHLRPKRCF